MDGVVLTRDEDLYGCGEGAGRLASVVAGVRDLCPLDEELRVGLASRGGRHGDPALTVVVDHAVVVVPKHVSAEKNYLAITTNFQVIRLL